MKFNIILTTFFYKIIAILGWKRCSFIIWCRYPIYQEVEHTAASLCQFALDLRKCFSRSILSSVTWKINRAIALRIHVCQRDTLLARAHPTQYFLLFTSPALPHSQLHPNQPIGKQTRGFQHLAIANSSIQDCSYLRHGSETFMEFILALSNVPYTYTDNTTQSLWLYPTML